MKKHSLENFFDCVIEEVNYATVFQTRTKCNAKNERRITSVETNRNRNYNRKRQEHGASLTKGWVKFPVAVRISAERATASLPKFGFTTRASR